MNKFGGKWETLHHKHVNTLISMHNIELNHVSQQIIFLEHEVFYIVERHFDCVQFRAYHIELRLWREPPDYLATYRKSICLLFFKYSL